METVFNILTGDAISIQRGDNANYTSNEDVLPDEEDMVNELCELLDGTVIDGGKILSYTTGKTYKPTKVQIQNWIAGKKITIKGKAPKIQNTFDDDFSCDDLYDDFGGNNALDLNSLGIDFRY